MPIPAVNLKPCLEATEAAWRARLDELFARMHFILGEQVASFEREFAKAFHAAHAITVGNGTAAIELCLRDAGITKPSQEVITTALTAPFTGVAIATPGCRIRFADVDPETLLLDPGDAGNRATKRTAAIVPVHLYGQPVQLAPFRASARSLGAVLIQDACQAHGATHLARPLTAYSPYVCYSFYPTKNLGCLGDGGAITTNSSVIAKRLLSRRDGGRRGGQVAYLPGINSRLDEMQACYLRAFLPKLDDWNNMRRHVASLYESGLRDCPGVTLLRTSAESVRHLFVIRAHRRDRLRAWLASKGIGTGIHYPAPLHLMPAFANAGLKRGSLPHAERAVKEILSLPIYPYLAGAAAEEVIGRVREFYQR
ncbi:MAG: DegT/DnrJ/EryC1/StrS family aminotransferase [Acidobacteriota bacterium]